MQPDVDNTPVAESEQDFNPNSFSGTLIVAVVLCLVCSMLVSAAAVGLRGFKKQNDLNKQRRNVLQAAGLWQPDSTDADIPELFQSVTKVLINLPRTGAEDSPEIFSPLDPASYDQRAASKSPDSSIEIPATLDVAGIKRREQVSAIYIVRDESGAISQFVLPVYGKGLWSTLYGFVAVDADTRTARGITFYEHGETPGLGGEVDNPKWKSQWSQKHLRDADGKVAFDVAKPGNAAGEYAIDGLSGATITSNGVENTIRYWLGPDGFGPFLDGVAAGTVEFPDAGPVAESESVGIVFQ